MEHCNNYVFTESLAANAEKIRTMTLQAKIQEEETLRLKRELEICQQQMARSTYPLIIQNLYRKRSVSAHFGIFCAFYY